jgi:integrase
LTQSGQLGEDGIHTPSGFVSRRRKDGLVDPELVDAQLRRQRDLVLRKTCGTRIADGGGGVAAIAAHLRHKDMQTANRYIDRTGASARAINALES